MKSYISHEHAPSASHTCHYQPSTAVVVVGSEVDHRIRGDFVVQRWRRLNHKRTIAVDAVGVDLVEHRHIALVDHMGLETGSNSVAAAAVEVVEPAVAAESAVERESARSDERPAVAVAARNRPAGSTAAVEVERSVGAEPESAVADHTGKADSRTTRKLEPGRKTLVEPGGQEREVGWFG